VSIPVDIHALRAELAKFGSGPLLITTAPEGPPHVTSVIVALEGDELVMGAGRKTLRNAAQRPAVALVWAPQDGGDYCLIVDGLAREGSEGTLVLQPTSAVLHRVASAPEGGPRCIPVEQG
jgi:hypothetical protein